MNNQTLHNAACLIANVIMGTVFIATLMGLVYVAGGWTA